MRNSGDPQSLRATGRYVEALSALAEFGPRRDLFTDDKILKAELLSLTGAVDQSNSLAEELISNRGLSISQRCRLRDVLATCAFRKGLHAKGMEHYNRGIELAESDGDLKSECLLRIHVLRYQNPYFGSNQAASSLTALRRKTHQIADEIISVKFQLALAEIATKTGLFQRAHKHLEAAKSLLSAVPDRGVHAEAKIAELALAAIESNLSDALRYAFELRSMAEETGSQAAKFAACVNLGHLLSAHARFDEAAFWLEQGLLEHAPGGSGELALRDTLMSLLISKGLDASLEAETISRLLAQPANRDSYYGLWHLDTRVKWLYRTGALEEGVALALDAIPRIERVGDRNLLGRIRLLAAEGLGRVGRAPEGADLLATAVLGNSDPPLELIAEASRVAGRLSAVDDPAAAYHHFDRAARILQSVGNLTARAEIERDAAETLSQSEAATVGTGHHSNPVKDAAPQTWAVSLVERIATIVDLGAHPPLLASETLALIADARASLSAAVTETRPDGTLAQREAFTADEPDNAGGHAGSVRIPLGRYRDVEYEIRAISRPSAAARAALLAVERLVQTALALSHARHQEREQAALWPEPTPEQQLGLVCASEKMLDLIKTVRRVATSNITVLITGETGVGKELFARALHQASARHDRTFLPFNCATVPKDMIESQLFGYKRGAFTGAHDDFPGLIRAAAGGTLFLDEIGDMSPEAQPKLLRFLESGEILPLGESRPQLVDVRIVAATNTNLDQLVTEGRFREDLYYRLNVVPLRVPPLRERREEIPALVDHFLERHSRELQKPLMRVAEETLEYLVLHKWPGNVRQLSNELRRMVALAEPGAVLMPEHLSPAIAASRRTVPADQRQLGPTEVVVRIDQPMSAAAEHVERAVIKRALAVCGGNGVEAAKMLGLSRKGLYLKRRRLGLE